MPDPKTRADAIRLYLTGAVSDGGVQSDPSASLGGYRSASQVAGLGSLIDSPLDGGDVVVDYVSPDCGSGAATIAASGISALTFAAPGESAGPAVSIANGQSKLLESSSGPDKFALVRRTSATDLTGSMSLSLSTPLNAIFDNVSAAEATAGDTEYRVLCLRVESVTGVLGLKLHLGTLGGQAAISGHLPATGAGSLSGATDAFTGWPVNGYVHLHASDGTTRELVYYSSRTDEALSVPADGRGLLGSSAAAGQSGDLAWPVSGLRLGAVAQPAGDSVSSLVDESTAPDPAPAWTTAITAADGINVGDLAQNALVFVYLERQIPPGAVSTADALLDLRWAFEAA